MSRDASASVAFAARTTKETIPLIAIPTDPGRSWLKTLPARHAAWLQAQGAALDKAGLVILAPDENGAVEAVYFSPTSHAGDAWHLAHLPSALPEGRYALDDTKLDRVQATQFAFGGAVAQLPDQRYQSKPAIKELRTLVWPTHAVREEVMAWGC